LWSVAEDEEEWGLSWLVCGNGRKREMARRGTTGRGKNNSALSEGLLFVYAKGRGDIVREIEVCVFWRWGRMDRLLGCWVEELGGLVVRSKAVHGHGEWKRKGTEWRSVYELFIGGRRRWCKSSGEGGLSGWFSFGRGQGRVGGDSGTGREREEEDGERRLEARGK
jgi:hypothetical protein